MADSGQGTLEDNGIYGNGFAGVAIRAGGNPTLSRNNRIHDGEQEGIWVGDDGKGTLEENDIFGTALRAWHPEGRQSHLASQPHT